MGKRACLLGVPQEAGQAGPLGPTCSVPLAPPRLQLGSLLLAMCPISLGISVWLPGNRGGGKRSGQSQLAWMPTPGLRAAGDHLQRSQERGCGWGPPGWGHLVSPMFTCLLGSRRWERRKVCGSLFMVRN